MIASLLLALDASQRPIGQVLFCDTVVGYMHRKLAGWISQHRQALNRLASWPQAEVLQAVSR
jgi:hypothetical protein